ncbi:MAG: thymidine phosphorylase [Opitutales bacterium]|nr:thymidine phosphorylase [Opitutales bacterium]
MCPKKQSVQAKSNTVSIVPLIEKKRDGLTWTNDDIRYIIDAIAHHTLPDYQLSALLMAIYFKDLNVQEIAAFAEEIILSGTVLDVRSIALPKISLYTIGGVGNKTNLALTALVASCGVVVPNVITPQESFIFGDLDKIKAIPGMKTDLPLETCVKQLKKIGCCISQKPDSLVPVDNDLIKMGQATATANCLPILVSSILSKRIASGSENIVVDIKCGNGSFIRDVAQAKHIASLLTKSIRGIQRRCVALITDMNQPVGNTLGTALELKEIADILQDKGDENLKELIIRLGMEMIRLSGVSGSTLSAKQTIVQHLKDGSAFKKFKELIKEQGGDPAFLENEKKFPKAKHTYKIVANKRGYIHSINMAFLAKGVEVLMRQDKNSPIDPAAGLTDLQPLGKQIQPGDPVMTIHYNDASRFNTAMEYLRKAYCIAPKRPSNSELFIERVA